MPPHRVLQCSSAANVYVTAAAIAGRLRNNPGVVPEAQLCRGQAMIVALRDERRFHRPGTNGNGSKRHRAKDSNQGGESGTTCNHGTNSCWDIFRRVPAGCSSVERLLSFRRL